MSTAMAGADPQHSLVWHNHHAHDAAVASIGDYELVVHRTRLTGATATAGSAAEMAAAALHMRFGAPKPDADLWRGALGEQVRTAHGPQAAALWISAHHAAQRGDPGAIEAVARAEERLAVVDRQVLAEAQAFMARHPGVDPAVAMQHAGIDAVARRAAATTVPDALRGLRALAAGVVEFGNEDAGYAVAQLEARVQAIEPQLADEIDSRTRAGEAFGSVLDNVASRRGDGDGPPFDWWVAKCVVDPTHKNGGYLLPPVAEGVADSLDEGMAQVVGAVTDLGLLAPGAHVEGPAPRSPSFPASLDCGWRGPAPRPTSAHIAQSQRAPWRHHR